MTASHHIVVAVLLAGWVAAWLGWMFDGEIRHAIIRWVLPARWTWDVVFLEDDYPIPVSVMSNDELTAAIAGSARMPRFLIGILTCPRCMSAHLAWVGLLPVAVAHLVLAVAACGFYGTIVQLAELALLPLCWGFGAWAGHHVFTRK